MSQSMDESIASLRAQRRRLQAAHESRGAVLRSGPIELEEVLELCAAAREAGDLPRARRLLQMAEQICSRLMALK